MAEDKRRSIIKKNQTLIKKGLNNLSPKDIDSFTGFFNPIEVLGLNMNDKDATVTERTNAAKSLLPYCADKPPTEIIEQIDNTPVNPPIGDANVIYDSHPEAVRALENLQNSSEVLAKSKCTFKSTTTRKLHVTSDNDDTTTDT